MAAPEPAGQPRTRVARAALVIAVVAIVVAAILLGVTVLQHGSSSPGPPPPRSCSVTVVAENATDTAIQSAIDTNPGGVICVGPGVFPEQVTITAPGTVLRGAGATLTTLAPIAPVRFNTYDRDGPGSPNGTPAAAIVLVQGSTGNVTSGTGNVTIEDLGINGSAGAPTFTTCGQNYFGVDFQASSGSLIASRIDGVALPPDLFGCQRGLAVYAYNGFLNFGDAAPGPSRVTVSDSEIVDFDKNAITCNDPRVSCVLTNNTVVGAGRTDLTAQNGVQIAFGALGIVSNNTVSDTGDYNGSGGCVAPTQGYYLNCAQNEGAGILLYDPANDSTVTGNLALEDQNGIVYFDDGLAEFGYSGPKTIEIAQNTVESSSAYGISAQGAPGGRDLVTIAGNRVDSAVTLNASEWGAPGVLVDTGDFLLSANTVSGSSTLLGSSNGVSQAVCGPTVGPDAPVRFCATSANLTTAGIQAASESAFNQTNLTLSGNILDGNSSPIATLGILGGVVNLRVS